MCTLYVCVPPKADRIYIFVYIRGAKYVTIRVQLLKNTWNFGRILNYILALWHTVQCVQYAGPGISTYFAPLLHALYIMDVHSPVNPHEHITAAPFGMHTA